MEEESFDHLLKVRDVISFLSQFQDDCPVYVQVDNGGILASRLDVVLDRPCIVGGTIK